MPATRTTFFLILIAATGAFAQSSTGDESSLLAGPKTAAGAAAPTLVERGMDGRLVRPEARPEVAALALITLTPEQREPVTEFLNTRAAKVTELLKDHRDLLLKIQAARQSDAREELMPLLRELRSFAVPLVEPPLMEQLAAKLPGEQAGQLRSIVGEYMRAVMAEESAKAPDNADRRGAVAAQYTPIPPRIEVMLLVRELARTLGEVVKERKERTDALIKPLDLTPEQDAKVRAIIRNAGEQANGSPSAQARREMWEKIMQELTPEQRVKAREAHEAQK
ncbi:MAG: hypothetical protein JSR77_12925 [Planctomycetes bacterium]|nr:hypothetical protein [Planctomycetota bacterium]